MAAERGDYVTYWRERAACLRVDPDLFFPIGTGGLTLEQVDAAKAVCGRCAVVQQCLDWAVQVGQVEGVWGGTTESERRAMRRYGTRRAKGTITTAA
ncbi:WhiB family transcriptional regulator [Streptomyces sp. NBC_00445]|uniref:WhiB family transcriptional regulator n=1 Tax=unclassified Streptomyces TaxID=2593676 RepID=UPI002E2413ED|nr:MULTISPECIES: WhiB family transcriptional regulator [unclassified Streptomyces]